MDSYCLRRDELEYELAVRGITNFGAETVRSMRLMLKSKQEKEKFGQLVTSDSYHPNIEYEIDVCNEKVVEMKRFLETFQGDTESEEARFMFSILQHLYGRLNRLHVDDNNDNADTWKTDIKNLLAQVVSLEAQTDSRCSSFRFSRCSSRQVASTQGPVQSSSISRNASTLHVHHKQIPVNQWGITFDAKRTGLSVNAFLEKVETYRVARHATEEELKDSLIDLLKGDAAIWYSSIRSSVDSWSTFVRLFKEEYLPHDHHEKLWELIRARYQNTNESVGTYFACMLNLFNRLEKQASEEEKLYILIFCRIIFIS